MRMSTNYDDSLISEWYICWSRYNLLHDDLFGLSDIAYPYVRFHENDIVLVTHTIWPREYGIGHVFK